MVVKKLLVDGKITACVKGVVCKVSNRKRLSCKKIAFLKNVCYPYLNFVLRVTYCFFMSC